MKIIDREKIASLKKQHAEVYKKVISIFLFVILNN
jgi:hypothetical protein